MLFRSRERERETFEVLASNRNGLDCVSDGVGADGQNPHALSVSQFVGDGAGHVVGVAALRHLKEGME